MSNHGPKLAGVMGWPVSHSLSPSLHGYWISERKLAAYYVPLAVRPDNLAQALEALPTLGFRGVSLTIPHKEAALSIVRELDDAANLIGAINTVVVTQDGRLTGRNTDADGYAESLRMAGIGAIDGHAIVLGAGGAARAVIFALHRMGVRRIVIANRTFDRAAGLRKDAAILKDLEVLPIEWTHCMRHAQGAGILVNTTALGMTGQPPLRVDLTGLPQECVVSDIVYRPLETQLLRDARARGHRTVDGLGMLLHQAVPAFEAFFGERPNVSPELRHHLETVMEPL